MARTVFAADLGGTKLAAAVIDSEGRILARKTAPVDKSAKLGPVKQIVSFAQELARYVGPENAPVAAGVAIPGLVRRNGRVWAPNLPGWDNIPLARMLQTRLGMPVVVESDRNAVVLGETYGRKGAARGKTDVIVLIVGTGIGAGILCDGRLLRGAHELSGCAGWMNVVECNLPEVQQVGCWEALVAGPGVARRAIRSSGKKTASPNITAEDLARLAREGNTSAKDVWRETGRLLGLGIANLVSLFDPQVIVLTGGTANAADLFWDELAATALRSAQPISAKTVQLRVTKLGAEANLHGCAKLAWEATVQQSPTAARAMSAGRK